MRIATIDFNRVCNENCAFCDARASEDDPSRVDPKRILGDILAAAREGAETLILTGGEPTLHPNLVSLVARAKQAGVENLVLETNGLLLASPGRTKALAEAGLTTVRLALNGPPEVNDAITRLPGGTEGTLAGARNALAEGLTVELACAVLPENREALPTFPAWLAETLPEVKKVWLRVIDGAPDSSVETLDYAAAAQAVAGMVDAARPRGITCTFHVGYAIPLCAFPFHRRYPELFLTGHRGGDDFTTIDACAQCVAESVCPGVSRAYLARHGPLEVEPLGEKSARFVRGLGGERERLVEQHLIAESTMHASGGGLERVLRINFHCNQDCEFCFVNRQLPSVEPDRIRDEIRRAKDDGVTLLSLSGGEPTLNPNLVEYVSLAHELGIFVRVQTNAVMISEGLATALKDAGVGDLFVSLHGGTAEVSDAVTRAPGTFVQTVAGIQALIAAGLPVHLNLVITTPNASALGEELRFVADTFGDKVTVNISFVHASTDMVPVAESVIPRLSEVRASLGEAITVADEAGVVHAGLDGACGMPLCHLEESWVRLEALTPLTGENPPRGFVKSAACEGCVWNDRCYGLRETYASLYGTDELARVSR